MNDNMETMEFIKILKRTFLSCAPFTNLILDLQNVKLDTEIQKLILELTVYNPLVKKYPVKASYQKSFMKKLIEKLEKENEEILDEFYNVYCEFMSSKECDAKNHYRHFILGSENDTEFVTIQESTSMISQGTTGLCSWQAASVLAEYCLKNKSKFEGKTIFELGSGVGLLGLVLVKKCSPRQYIFSDGHPKVIEMLRSNVLLNEKLNVSDTGFKRSDVQIVHLLWEEIEKWIGSNEIKLDVILAADILFDHSVFPALVEGLKMLLSSSECYAIFAATVRNEETLNQFLQELDKNKISHEDLFFKEENILMHSGDTPVRLMELKFL